MVTYVLDIVYGIFFSHRGKIRADGFDSAEMPSEGHYCLTAVGHIVIRI